MADSIPLYKYTVVDCLIKHLLRLFQASYFDKLCFIKPSKTPIFVDLFNYPLGVNSWKYDC